MNTIYQLNILKLHAQESHVKNPYSIMHSFEVVVFHTDSVSTSQIGNMGFLWLIYTGLIWFPTLYASFVEDQYMSIFAVALHYTNPFK